MALATLSVDLVARLAKFEGDMGKAARASEQASQRMVASMDSVKAAIGGLAVGVSFAGIIALGKASVNSIDALNDLKDATGASVENISALEDVAARTGANFDTVSTSLIKFNAALKDAKPGSDAESAFKALGLSIKELQGLDPAEALLKTATALSTFADDGNKARLTQELFGKSLKEVAPFLKDLADKGELVATVTTAQAQAAEDFNKQLFALQKNSQDATRSIATELLPVLNVISQEFVSVKDNGDKASLIGEPLRVAFEAIAIAGANVSFVFKGVGREIGAIAAQAAALARGDLVGFSAISDAVKADGVAAAAEVDKLEKRILGAKQSINGASIGAAKPSIGTLPVKKQGGKDPNADFEAYLKHLDNQITKTVELSTAEQLVFDIQQKRVTVTPDQEEELRLRAELIDVMKAEEIAAKALDNAKKTANDYIAGLVKETKAMEQNNKELSLHVEEIGLTKTQLNSLTLARMDDAIALAQQARAQLNLQNSSEQEIADIERKIELLREKRQITANGQIATASADDKEKADKASKDFADTLQNDLKGAFSAAFKDSSGEPLKAFGDAIANVIFTRAATAFAESLIGSAGGTDSGSILSKIFSFDGGGFTGSGARVGGLDGKGGFMAMVHPNETILDHTRGQRSGSGGNIYNFTVGDVASVSMVRQAVAGSERRIAGAMGRSMNYGGALS